MKMTKEKIGIFVIAFLLLVSISPMISSETIKSSTVPKLRIDFFERFCNMENLSKASMFDFPSTIYLAAHSYEEFKEAKKNLYGNI